MPVFEFTMETIMKLDIEYIIQSAKAAQICNWIKDKKPRESSPMPFVVVVEENVSCQFGFSSTTSKGS